MVLVPLAILCLALGLFPQPVIRAIEPGVNRVVETINLTGRRPASDEGPHAAIGAPGRVASGPAAAGVDTSGGDK
jgi:hypothetical protein